MTIKSGKGCTGELEVFQSIPPPNAGLASIAAMYSSIAWGRLDERVPLMPSTETNTRPLRPSRSQSAVCAVMAAAEASPSRTYL